MKKKVVIVIALMLTLMLAFGACTGAKPAPKDEGSAAAPPVADEGSAQEPAPVEEETPAVPEELAELSAAIGVWEEMLARETYSYEAGIDSFGGLLTSSVSVDNGNFAVIDTYKVDDFEATTRSVYKDGIGYEIDDEEKTIEITDYAADGITLDITSIDNPAAEFVEGYYSWVELYTQSQILQETREAVDATESEQEQQIDAIVDEVADFLAVLSQGEGEIDGKTLPYYEFAMKEVSTRFYIENGIVVAVENIAGEETSDIVVFTAPQYSIPEGVFDIPEGYTEI